jgi:hypothetical protein
VSPNNGSKRFSSFCAAPAQHVIQHKTVKFHRGWADDVPVFETPPSPEVDQVWKDLWVGTSFKVECLEFY